ncbi:MAG: ATP-dependent helicase [Elusimicrobia bacterium]|nr:ATP-dependent helicase [Elusimicrobiota bacterium]
MKNLSPAQQRVVTAQIGLPIQVLASAGSGKTRVLTERVRHILSSTKKDGVIAVTFTNKAADEMRARLDDIQDIDERAWITTIHSLAQRIVEQYGNSIGLPGGLHIYERDQDRKTIFLQSLRSNGTDVDAFLNVDNDKERRDRERVIQGYLDKFSALKRDLLNEAEAKARHADDENFWSIYSAYKDALIQGGGMDYDDLLVYAHKILLEQPWCAKVYRAKFKHVCVDEAQDLNRAQYELVKAFCGQEVRSLLMVGDPYQMIYGFNGSSRDFLCETFVRDFAPERFELKENYRCSKAVIKAANAIWPKSQVGLAYALAGRFSVRACKDEQEEASFVCDTVQSLVQQASDPEIEGPIELKKMVVIGRNRFVFQAIEEELKARAIPYSLKKGERASEPSSVLMKTLDFSIRLRLNPRAWPDGKKLCENLGVEPPDSWGDEAVLLRLAEAAQSAEVIFPEAQEKVLRWIAAIDAEHPNVPKLCSDVEKLFEHRAKAKSAVLKEIETTLLELKEFKANWIKFKKKGLGESLSAFRNAMALGQLGVGQDESGLILSTVHTMKGLERDIVFIVGMCEGVFPDYRAKTAKEIEEETNSAFVAVTRSRRWLFVSYPKIRKMPWGDLRTHAPSRFVKTMERAQG